MSRRIRSALSLPRMLNERPTYEDWFGYVNGILDHLHSYPTLDYGRTEFWREAKRRGRTGILRLRQAIMCVEQGVDCAAFQKNFYHTGDSDLYSSDHEQI